MSKTTKPLFHLAGVPVTAEPSAIFSPLNVFGLALWLASPRPWADRLRLGLLAVLAYEIASVIHTLGHILSSRQVQAPMDEVHLAMPLPRTLYYDDQVSPQKHCGRAIGGPIASGLAFLTTLGLRPFVPARLSELFNLMSLTNGFLFGGSLLPLPFVDGGVLLKWSLVAQGRSVDQADQAVRQANLLLGGVTTAISLVLGLKWPGKAALLGLIQGSMLVATGLGKLKL